mgnify:FL=1
MIWRFDNSNTYLLGSIHILKDGGNCYEKQIDNIYSQSNHIVFEANLDKIPLSLLRYSDGNKLSDNIPQNLFKKTKKKWSKFGLPETDLEQTKPWQVANILTMKLLERKGFSFDNGIDKQLFTRAKADNKSIDTLEPESFSLQCFDNAPLEEQLKYLSSVIDNPDACIYKTTQLLKAWSKPDIDVLTGILQENLKTFPVLFQCLVINRNKAWINTILTSIKTNNPTLIAVGALHCVDMCSIQCLIQDIHGYNASLITNKAL